MRRTVAAVLVAMILSSPVSAADRTEEIIKSCLLPGWGQISAGRYTRGTVMMGVAIVTFGAIGGLTLQYNRHVDSYEQAAKGYSQATYIGDAESYYSRMTDSWNDADDAYGYRNVALGVLAGMYLWSILDMTLGPEASTPPVSLEIRKDGFMVAGTLRF